MTAPTSGDVGASGVEIGAALSGRLESGPNVTITFITSRHGQNLSVHPGHSVAEVIENTGFDFDRPADVPTTPAPSADTLHMMRIGVGPMVADVYPQFAKSVFCSRRFAQDKSA